ncbi:MULTISPECIES: N-acetylmuramic acid 6-phosphate etherase [Reichenbachiella]|uniref:N-acetylmuramic acid 6-phosphate etherase n=1 Tax=Reichenbachiella agariperforans TaxID=156994 RepID=A0A1M6Q3F1_REIAG|nr:MULTISPECIES: N-acetylmuramic acid 6-phosphate etherase [Reichenbachiella]MBU2914206.1 N-acetylmuramic acid 6-phosphate etherase [Reichenbachiella agariperforans]RJE72940.1 N-acetylmuramic acid 6-phosphate etherase [Reichenbachiella sp. MSK19-1]SHK14720.1 N-acetylmuramic acid 6-phosphate etherase [Reichenbachiella agariperforans]
MTITESPSNFSDLDKMSVLELLSNINKEDHGVSKAVEKVIPQVQLLVEGIVRRMKKGGRLFYIGAGTSGRLGILDASECPPTYGVSQGLIVGIIAGGDQAIRVAVENAEDDENLAWEELSKYDINELDSVIGIAASGNTPYVVGGVKKAKEMGIFTGGICCNIDTKLVAVADHTVEVIVGPEFVTGSTRMKAGTAQKLVLNMISTSVMIKLGKVKGNKMVDMQLSNKKLVKRAIRMIIEETGVEHDVAAELLDKYKSVRNAVDNYKGVTQGVLSK